MHHGIRSHGTTPTPPPPPELDRLTNTTEDITFPHTTYAGGNEVGLSLWHNVFRLARERTPVKSTSEASISLCCQK